jgi:hypothetical protein
MATTFTKIASVSVGSGGAASINFSSIPATYTDLVVKVSLRQTIGGLEWESITIDFNGLTTNQDQRVLYTGNGTSVSNLSNARMNAWVNASISTASTFSNTELYIPNYAGSNNKSVSIDNTAENNGTISFLSLHADLWSSSSAINQITFTPNGGTFVQYSTATLYGISKS